MKLILERSDIPWSAGAGYRTFWEVRTDDNDVMYILKNAYRDYEVDEHVSISKLVGQKFTTLEAALKAIEDSYD